MKSQPADHNFPEGFQPTVNLWSWHLREVVVVQLLLVLLRWCF
jgi:hypothetical protein